MLCDMLRAQHVESNVAHPFAAFNTYNALCKCVACNTQQNRTFPILLSVAFNTFKTTNTNRASEHVTIRVSLFDLTKKGTPSSLTNLKLLRPASGVFPGQIITTERCDIVICSGMQRLSVNKGQFNDR